MTKIKATLIGIPQQKYEPQSHLTRKKPKVQSVEVFSFVFDAEEPMEVVRIETKYKYLIHPRYRKKIEAKYKVKIPIFIRKLEWKLEEVIC